MENTACLLEKMSSRAEEMARGLGALTALLEDRAQFPASLRELTASTTPAPEDPLCLFQHPHSNAHTYRL